MSKCLCFYVQVSSCTGTSSTGTVAPYQQFPVPVHISNTVLTSMVTVPQRQKYRVLPDLAQGSNPHIVVLESCPRRDIQVLEQHHRTTIRVLEYWQQVSMGYLRRVLCNTVVCTIAGSATQLSLYCSTVLQHCLHTCFEVQLLQSAATYMGQYQA